MSLFNGQFRQSLRRLARAPLFTAITLITLAVGIGANTVVFSVVNGVLLKPLSYPQPDRLIGVWHAAPGINLTNLNMAPFLYFIDREQSKTIEDIGIYQGDSVSLTGSGQPERVPAMDVTDAILPLLGVKPTLGRVFTRRDDQPDTPRTVVLAHSFWLRKFGGDASVIGRSVTLDGNSCEVIGVLPAGFHFLYSDDIDLYLPMQLDRAKTKLGNFSYEGIARLKPGVTLNQVNAELDHLLPIAIHSFPAPEGFSVSLFEKAGLRTTVHPLKQDVIGNIGSTLWVLMGSIAVVLLVACANVANLLLVRVEGRRQELAIRTALGAGRRRIAAGLFSESTVLAVSGTVIGLALAYGALRILVALAPTGLPRLHEIGIDLPVVLFACGLAQFVGLVIGLIPVLKYAGANLQSGLREGGRGLSQGRDRHRARKALVVVQVALALVLLICSGLMIRTFNAMTHVNPGFTSPETLETFRIYIPETTIPDGQDERVLRMEQAIQQKLAAIPGVDAVSFSTSVPLDGNQNNDPVYAQDHVYKEGEIAPLRRFKFMAPGFLSAIGTPLLVGRDFTWDDEYGKRNVAIVAESTAKDYWKSASNAVGKKIRVGSTDEWREIVGVVADTYDNGVDEPPVTAVYWPLMQSKFEGHDQVRRGVAYALRSRRAGSSAFKSEVERAVWSVNGDLSLEGAQSVKELYTRSMARTSFTLIMLCVAGGMALLLGIVGIYGVISYSVSQRTREIGIRMAMGAQRQALTSLFVRQGLILAAVGAVLGMGAAFAFTRLMSAILFNVSPMDPLTYAGATIAIVLIAWAACYMPSRRASAVNPVQALRAE